MIITGPRGWYGVGRIQYVLKSFRGEASKVWNAWGCHRDLVLAFTKRDVLLKYRGSLLGFLWSFITPLVLLVIYTIVFGLIFKMQWGGGEGGMAEFAVMLFCGLIPFGFYQDALSKSCTVVVSSPNYVKRIFFPIEVLPLSMTLSAFVHALISCVILIVAAVCLLGKYHFTFLLLPIVWLPVLISAVACSVMVSALGVFIRDLDHIIGLVFAGLFFLTPIFYPASSLPEKMQFIVFINPMAYAATNLRKIIVLGMLPNWWTWILFMAASIIGLTVSSWYFQKIRKRFADVL